MIANTTKIYYSGFAMIVLAVGMPRAGSGWHYNLIHDLVVANGGSNSREIRQKYHLEKILTEVNCNISALTLRRMSTVLLPAWKGETFVVKAHSGPTLIGNLAMDLGWMKTTYIFRDPRDALLSAMDFGKRTADKGHPNVFSHLTTTKAAVEFMLDYCVVWENWMMNDNVLKSKYEDLLTNYEMEVQKLLGFLEIKSDQSVVQEIVERFRPGKAKEGKDGLHFFKGQIGRFRDVFSADDQQFMAEQFKPYLAKMSYEI